MKNPLSSVASVLAAVMSFTPVYSLTALASDDVTVPACGWTVVTGPDGVCEEIYDNNCGNTMYVADNTVAEWQNFYSNPNGATLVGCGTGTGTGGTGTGG